MEYLAVSAGKWMSTTTTTELVAFITNATVVTRNGNSLNTIKRILRILGVFVALFFYLIGVKQISDDFVGYGITSLIIALITSFVTYRSIKKIRDKKNF